MVKAEGEEKTTTIEELEARIERLDSYIDRRIDSVNDRIDILTNDLKNFKEKFALLINLLVGKKVVTEETAEHFVEKNDLKPESVIKWFLNQVNSPAKQENVDAVSKDDHEINYGVCEYCGRFNLGTRTECEYCKKSLEKKPIVSPAEGV